MHPLYKKRKLTARIVAVCFIAVGIPGIALPLLQGFLFIAVGVSLWSIHSSRMRSLAARYLSGHAKLQENVSAVESWVGRHLKLAMHTSAYMTIPGQEGGSLSLLVEEAEEPAGTAVLLHGASGVKEGPLMETLAEHFRERGYNVVRFDATNGLGESSGHYTMLTPTNYATDLVTVVAWVRTQSWHAPALPLALAGHSIGGLIAGYYASKHPEEVAELVLFAPTVSGLALARNLSTHDPEGTARWRESGLRLTHHPLRNDTESLGYGFVEDVQDYDLLPHASAITAATRILVGEDDRTTLPADCETLKQAMRERARLYTLPHVRHSPIEHSELARIKEALSK